jgi:glutathione S-transferase
LCFRTRPKNYGYPEDFSKTDEGKAKTKELRENFGTNTLPPFLTYLEQQIEANGGKFLCGDSPTIADCFALPTLRNFTKGHIDFLPVTCLEVNPKIVQYVKDMMAIPAIEKWYAPK